MCVKSRGFQDTTDYQLTVSEEGRTEIIWWKLDIEVSIILTWHSMSGCGSGWAAVKSLDDKNHIWAPSSQLVNSDPTPKSPVETYWLECKAWVDAYQPEIFPNQAGRQRRHTACLSFLIPEIWGKTMLREMCPKDSRPKQIPNFYVKLWANVVRVRVQICVFLSAVWVFF